MKVVGSWKSSLLLLVCAVACALPSSAAEPVDTTPVRVPASCGFRDVGIENAHTAFFVSVTVGGPSKKMIRSRALRIHMTLRRRASPGSLAIAFLDRSFFDSSAGSLTN